MTTAAGLVDQLEVIYDDGAYPLVSVTRPWSDFNPTITGELAQPGALRGYLERELGVLLAGGAQITVSVSRPQIGRAHV